MSDDKSHENNEGSLSQYLFIGWNELPSMKRMATVIGRSYVCVDGHICTPDCPGVDTRDMGYHPPVKRP